jgi:hypothetical protein
VYWNRSSNGIKIKSPDFPSKSVQKGKILIV